MTSAGQRAWPMTAVDPLRCGGRRTGPSTHEPSTSRSTSAPVASRITDAGTGPAAAAGNAETVAELLIEHHREFVWGGRIEQFLGWVRWLPSERLLERPLLPAAGATCAALLARPEVETQRLLAVAERARQQRPQLWSPYLEAVVEVTRAM